MQVGDLIRFSSTGCQGVVTKIRSHGANKMPYVHVLHGPDADGEHNGEVLAYPQAYITSAAEVINASR
jgi:hypothetical protein